MMTEDDRKKSVMLDFIKVIYRMMAKEDLQNCSDFDVTIGEFIKILNEDIKDYDILINAFRKYQKEPILNNLRELKEEIHLIYQNLPRYDWIYYGHEADAAAYIIRDKSGARMSPEKIISILNDQE